MKKSTKKTLLTIFSAVILVACLAITSFAANSDVIFKANAEDDNTVIATQVAKDGKSYLFLPSSADLTNLVLYFDADSLVLTADNGSVNITSGEAFDLTAICTAKNGEYTVTLSDGKTLTIMKSANVRALFYVSDDPVNKGRPWVDTSKSNEAEGFMSLVGTDGVVDHTDEVTELKGRGNTTFTSFDKKPYQIKIDKKTALIKGSSEKSKKWVLLANAADNTLLHNTVTFALADMIGMPFTTSFEPIDFYFDGEYRGHYLLTEKVEVDSTRVDIDDLDSRIEDLNEDTDAYENPVVVTKTTASKGETNAAANSKGSYKYVQGLIEPELPDGANHHAYLLELEFAERYPDEQTGFVSNRGQAVVTKNPEYLTKESGAFISAFWQEFEDAVYSTNGYNAKTGKYYYEYCDLDSLVNIYLIHELGKNVDGFGSSTYFYLPENEDILYAGPVWDFDRCYGVGSGAYKREILSNPENFYITTKYLADGLIKIESFRNAVKAALDKENGEFYNAVMELLGNNGIIAQNSAFLNQQQKLNFKIWELDSAFASVVLPGKARTYDNTIEFLQYFIEERVGWLSSIVSTWSGNNYSIPVDTEKTPDEPKPEENLSFFERIIAFFQSIIDWFISLFSF